MRCRTGSCRSRSRWCCSTLRPTAPQTLRLRSLPLRSEGSASWPSRHLAGITREPSLGVVDPAALHRAWAAVPLVGGKDWLVLRSARPEELLQEPGDACRDDVRDAVLDRGKAKHRSDAAGA